MWEYKKETIRYTTNKNFIDQLNKYGKDGWEIISFFEPSGDQYLKNKTCNILFKREIKEAT
jgi:hypothetical protein